MRKFRLLRKIFTYFKTEDSIKKEKFGCFCGSFLAKKLAFDSRKDYTIYIVNNERKVHTNEDILIYESKRWSRKVSKCSHDRSNII